MVGSENPPYGPRASTSVLSIRTACAGPVIGGRPDCFSTSPAARAMEYWPSTSTGSPARALVIAGWSFLIGIVLFSGSLYGLALNGPSMLGPVTPIGGVAFVVGWLALIGAALRR